MTDKKTPTMQQMADYRQMYKTAVLAADFDRIHGFESEYDVFTKVYEENGMMGVKDAAGEVLVPAMFDDIACTFTDCCRGFAIPVVKGAKLAFAAPDGKGTLVSDFEYDSVHFTDGFYILIKEGKQGLADGCGQVLIPATMDKVYVPFNSLVVYENEGKYGFAMLGYDVYTETEYDDYDVIDENLEVIKDGVKGYIDFEGNFTQDEDEKFFNCSC